MALDKTTLKASIKQAFVDQIEKTDNAEVVLGDLADKIATAIDIYIKSGSVSVNVNTTVTGTCATPAGPGTIAGSGTGSGTGTIS